MTDEKMTSTRVRDILADVEIGMKGWGFTVGHYGSRGHPSPAVYLQVRALTICNDVGAPMEWSGRKWHVSPYATKSEVVATALKAVLTAQEHEARERFKYKGVRVFDPHVNVEALVEVMDVGGVVVHDNSFPAFVDARDVRQEKRPELDGRIIEQPLDTGDTEADRINQAMRDVQRW